MATEYGNPKKCRDYRSLVKFFRPVSFFFLNLYHLSFSKVLGSFFCSGMGVICLDTILLHIYIPPSRFALEKGLHGEGGS